MTFEVAASPEDENEMEEFRFRLDGLTLHFVRFRRYTRTDETAPWQVQGEWVFPDIFHKGNLPQPEVPQWAILDAKTYIKDQIKISQ